MSATGIGAVYLETHNWGRAASFFRSLGFELEFETDHRSGQLRGSEGPPIFIAEIPDNREPRSHIVLAVPDAATVAAEVVSPLEDTHYGTREMTVRDPDGRCWIVQESGSTA